MFVDASAIVSMLILEDDFEALADLLDAEPTRITSGLALWEAALAVSRAGKMPIYRATDEVRMFVSARGIEVVPVGVEEALVALDAQRRYGKGRHAARLNMGDCFAYACAKTNDARLLYKGDDFSYTDLAL